MQSIFTNLALFLVLALLSPCISAQSQSREITERMLQEISKLKGLKYNTEIQERINGKLEPGTNFIKVNFKPFKAYVKVSSAELLYVEGENNNKALIKANSIPYFNVSLDPKSSLLRKGQHHTIFEIGFSYFADIIRDGIRKSGSDFDKIFTIKGSTKHDNRDCWVLNVEAPDFKWVPYTVSKGETVSTIARKLKVSEYMVFERNKLKDYNSVKEGQVIQVPSNYALRTIVYIDKQSFLPVVQIIFDDLGIFARYEYHNLVINPPFSEKEFSKDFPDYKFW
jgi:LysM repeat protein